MSENIIEEKPNLEIGPPPVDSEWILFHGRTGKGKTLFMTGLAHERVRDLVSNGEKVLVISNYSVLNLPEGVELFKSGSIRKIMERMVEASTQGVAIVVCLDEIDKSLGMKQSATNVSVWLTTLASNARKYNVKSFYFTTQGRKASDYRLRVNVTFIVLPTTELDPFGHPTAWVWNDPMTWDVDVQHPKGKYEEASKVWLDDTLGTCIGNYNTYEVIPPDFNPTISNEELPEVVEMFIKWCASKNINLLENKRQDIRSYITRWNKDPEVFLVPYSKLGEQVLFTELLRLGLIEQKEEPEVERKENIENVDEVPTIPVRGQVQFCCGKLQSNMYKHRTTRKHLKSVETGVETVNKDETTGPD